MAKKSTRLLAAIMFTDMVGYTALMQEDEQQAKKNRDRHRKILQDSIEAHHGKILQYYGDGTLSIFNSAIEAVNCAIQIQQELLTEPKIPLRIGLHTGDIVYDDEGVYGDGVNVASRIEGLAISGSVLISGKVFDDIKNHQAFKTVSLGIFDLKNVKKPVEVYAISNEGLTVPAQKEIKAIPKDKVKSLAVLPFVNMSPDPEQEYFSDGITEEITADLSHVHGIRVISRTSSMQLKGTDKDMKTIARELNVQYVLEGSVRKAGNALRITAQLIDAINDKHLWSEKYSGTLDDVFEIQEKVSRSIAEVLKLKLHPEEDKKIAERPIENAHAYEFYFRAKKTFGSIEEKTLDRGLRDIQSGIRLVGDNELLYASMGRIYWQYVKAGIKGEEYLIKAEECSKKIFTLNPESYYGYFLLGIIEYKRGKTQEAIKHIEKVIGTDPAGTEILKWLQDYDAQKATEKDIAVFEKKLLEIDPLTSFDKPSLQVPVDYREETKNIFQYIKKPKVIAGIFIILVLAFVAVWSIDRVAKVRWAKERAIPELEQSIAVLPFKNFSADPDQEWLVSGQHDILITELSKLSQVKPLRVISRHTVNSFKDYEKSIPEIAQEINVDYLVEASVSGFADSITLQLRLIQALPEESIVLAQSFTGDISNIFRLYSNIAGQIAQKINLDLSPEDKEKLPSPRKVNPESYKAYLRGMYHLNQLTPEGMEKGLEYLHEAVRIDPGEPFAYAGLAHGYIEIAHGPFVAGEALIKAEAAALQAIKLDTTLAEIYAALAEVHLYALWEFDQAEKYFIKALELNPNLAITHYHYSWGLYLWGRMEEAIAEHKLAQKYDPFNPLNTAWLGGLYCYDGRYEDAIQEVHKSFEIQKDYPVGYYVLGTAYLAMGRYEEAIEAHKKLVEVAPGWKYPLGYTYAMTGNYDEAKKILKELEESEVSPFNAIGLTVINAALGKMDEAFKWLAYEPHHGWIAWAAVAPHYKNLRKDPRFEDFLKRLNLPD